MLDALNLMAASYRPEVRAAWGIEDVEIVTHKTYTIISNFDTQNLDKFNHRTNEEKNGCFKSTFIDRFSSVLHLLVSPIMTSITRSNIIRSQTRRVVVNYYR